MRTAICPGSFDPITLGHLNIIRRAAAIFDQVVVCVTVNSEKTSPMFTNEEKIDMVRRAVAKYEFQMDLINKRINPALETMFLTADQRYTFLSSSIVREMARYGADLKGLVPDELIGFIEEKATIRRA